MVVAVFFCWACEGGAVIVVWSRPQAVCGLLVVCTSHVCCPKGGGVPVGLAAQPSPPARRLAAWQTGGAAAWPLLGPVSTRETQGASWCYS